MLEKIGTRPGIAIYLFVACFVLVMGFGFSARETLAQSMTPSEVPGSSGSTGREASGAGQRPAPPVGTGTDGAGGASTSSGPVVQVQVITALGADPAQLAALVASTAAQNRSLAVGIRTSDDSGAPPPTWVPVPANGTVPVVRLAPGDQVCLLNLPPMWVTGPEATFGSTQASASGQRCGARVTAPLANPYVVNLEVTQ